MEKKYIVIDGNSIITVSYTHLNGGTLALSVLYSFLFFKEKPTPTRTCGIALALAGIVMLSV